MSYLVTVDHWIDALAHGSNCFEESAICGVIELLRVSRQDTNRAYMVQIGIPQGLPHEFHASADSGLDRLLGRTQHRRGLAIGAGAEGHSGNGIAQRLGQCLQSPRNGCTSIEA